MQKSPFINTYPICKVIHTDRGLDNGPNLPSMRLDTLKLCFLCQPGPLHPNVRFKCREQMRLGFFFFFFFRVMQEEGQHLMRAAVSTSTLAGLCCSLSALLGALFLPTLGWDSTARCCTAGIPGLALPGPPSLQAQALRHHNRKSYANHKHTWGCGGEAGLCWLAELSKGQGWP